MAHDKRILVSFGPKESWQKDDCINCEDTSTLVAKTEHASIRCCEKPQCIEHAKLIAIESEKRWAE
jgi:hypothetical protein